MQLKGGCRKFTLTILFLSFLFVANCDDEEGEILMPEFGSKIERQKIPTATKNNNRENVKEASGPGRSIDPMLALQNLIKSKTRGSQSTGSLLKHVSNLGLNLGNLTLDPNSLQFDKKLLGKIKQMIPGIGSVEDLQGELDGMLFGTNKEETPIVKAQKEPFIPSIPDDRFRVRERASTTPPPTQPTTTSITTTSSASTTTRQEPLPPRRTTVNETLNRNNIPTSTSKVIVDGDRAEFDDYDYNDYDMYSYEDENEPGGNETLSDMLPLAAEQRQRRPLLQRRRFWGPEGRRPGRVRPNRRKVGGRRSEVELDDLYDDYRAPPIQDIPGRIQGLPHDNIGALEEELVLNDDYEDQYVPQPSIDLAHPRVPGKPSSGIAPTGSLGPQASTALATNQKVDCDFYTTDLCLDVTRYPGGEIVGLLSKNRRIGADLIADVLDQSADNLVDGVTAAQENRYTFTHYYGNRREDGANHVHRDFAQEGGFLCPSEIKYAKPKRGKTAQGIWKDIVNVNDYTQTLRMEKCLKPGGSCSYVSHHYKSQCSQVYNYHRLLSWDKARGLHMDIYKVPTCCSCHIMGYSYIYPPLNSPSGRVVEPTQEFFNSESFSASAPAPSSNSLSPQAIQNNEFQNFVNHVGNQLPFKREGPLSDPGASSPNGVAARPPPPPPPHQQTSPPLIPTPIPDGVPPKRLRPRLNKQRRPIPQGRPPNNKLVPPRRRTDDEYSQRKNPLQRLMDQSFFGSDAVETTVLAPPEMTVGGKEAPHLKYQTIPIYDEQNLEGKISSSNEEPDDEEEDEELEMTEAAERSTLRSGTIQTPETERKKEDQDQPKSLGSVNYGYHPIIDFFDRYRFDAAS